MQIQEALSQFLLQLEANGRSMHTTQQYARHVGAFIQWLSGQSLEAVDHQTVARFFVSPQATKRPDGKAKKPASMNALRTSIRCFFSYVSAAGLVRENPAHLVKRAVCSPPPPRFLSEAEQQRLVAALDKAKGKTDTRDRILFLLMMRTGVRLGSALNLDVEDVNLPEQELMLRHVKGGCVQRVFLPDALITDLEAHVRDLQGPVFQGHPGERLSPRHARRRFRHWLERAKVNRNLGPHSLRHSFAASLYRKTGDIFLVKEALGHRSITSTMVYSTVDAARLRSAICE